MGNYSFNFLKLLRDLYVYYQDPITLIDKSVFGGSISTSPYNAYAQYNEEILHVPAGSTKYYRARAVWNEFKTIIEEEPEKPELELVTLKITTNVGGSFDIPIVAGMNHKLRLAYHGNIPIIAATFNGIDIKSQIDVDGFYTTPVITGNSELILHYQEHQKEDINKDGLIDVTDINSVIKAILGN